MIATNEEAKTMECCWKNQLCSGKKCMGWVWDKDQFECKECGTQFDLCSAADVCHPTEEGNFVKIKTGHCGGIDHGKL